MGCETLREVKELARDRAEWRRVVASNQSLDCLLNDDEIKFKILVKKVDFYLDSELKEKNVWVESMPE